MRFSKDFGIAITEDIKNIIDEAEKKVGGELAFSRLTSIPQPTLSSWMGKGKRKGEFITWDAWPPLRRHLAALNLLDESDTKWMTPTELRASLDRVTRCIPHPLGRPLGEAVREIMHRAELKLRRESAYKVMGRELQEGENPDDLVGVTVECWPEGQKKQTTRDGVMLASAKFVTAIMGADNLDDSQKISVIRLFKSFFPDDVAELMKDAAVVETE